MRRWQQQQQQQRLQRNASIRVGAAEARPSSSRLERTTTPRTAHAMDTLAELERCELMYPTTCMSRPSYIVSSHQHLAEDARTIHVR